MGHESLPGSHGREGRGTSWMQQLELISFSRSGGPRRRMINGSEMDLPCSCVCPGIQEDQQGSRWQETEGGVSQNPSSKTRAPDDPAHLEVSLRVTTKCQRKFELPMNPNDPAVSKSCEGFTIGW